MKIFVLVLFVVLLPVTGRAQHKSLTNDDLGTPAEKSASPNVDPKDGGPSFQETIDFLKEKIRSTTPHTGKLSDGVEYNRSHALTRHDGCRLTVEEKQYYDVTKGKLHGQLISQVTLKLSNLNTVVSVASDEEGPYIDIISTGNGALYWQYEFTPLSGSGDSFNKDLDHYKLHFTDKEIAERVSKAFSRAIYLCGGQTKKEAF